MKMYGNMTSVEKQMNKDDLIAWKKYDNVQHSLIPGISSNKVQLDRSEYDKNHIGGQVVDPRYHEKQDRLRAYGYTRDANALK